MLAQQVAKKYSTALFNLVRDRDLIDQASVQFRDLDALIKSDKTLLQFLLAPHIRDQNKTELIRTVFGTRIEPLFLEFVMVLIEKHRIGFLHEIIEEFRMLVAEERGLIVARVISTSPLSDKERGKLVAQLKAKTGKIIELEERIDPSILGGMIVYLRDQVLDGSVRHNLALLRDELMKLKVS